MNFYISRTQLHELIEDAYRQGWCHGFAADMMGGNGDSAKSFELNKRSLKSAQYITTYDYDLRGKIKRERKERRARLRGGGQ